MNDFNYSVEDLAQYASGYITYGNPVEAEFATGSITFGSPVKAEFASIQISVVDYTQLVGKTVTIDGQVLTEGVHFTAATDNNTTGTSLAAAIDALANWTATGPGSVVAKWNVRGTVGNGKSVTTNASGGLDIAGNGVSGGTTSGGVNGDTVAVGGNTFTAVQSAPGANEFTDIAGLEALVEAVTNINSSQNGSVVSIAYATRGVAGNAVTLVLGGSNAGTMAVSGATLTGGVNGDTVTVNGQLFTAVASSPGANEFSSIAELEALIEALASVNSSQDGTTVTINADAPGTAGNAITLALGGSNAGTMAISGATLTGGVNETYTDYLQIDEESAIVKAFIKIANLTSGATVTMTPQTSLNAEDWIDLPSIIFTSNGDTMEEVEDVLTYNRMKIVVNQGSSTSPTVDITLKTIGAPASPEREHDFNIPSALAASGVVKTSRGKFYGISGYINETAPSADLYLYVYDAVSVPADGALDASLLLMPPLKINQSLGLDTEINFDYSGRFKRATNGIVWFLSTTGGLTKTLAGAYAMLTIETE